MLHVWQQLTPKTAGGITSYFGLYRELLITEQSECSSNRVLLYHHFYARQASYM